MSPESTKERDCAGAICRYQGERGDSVDYRVVFGESPVALLYLSLARAVGSLVDGGAGQAGALDIAGASRVISGIEVLDANKAALALFGATEKEDLERRFSDTFTEPSRRAFFDCVRSLSSGETGFETETTIKNLNGETRRVSARLSVAPESAEPLSAVLVSMVDITDQRNAEARARALAKFPSENPNPVLRVSRDHVISYANAAAQTMLGIREYGEGKRPPKDVREWVEEASRTKAVVTRELTIGDRVFSLVLHSVKDDDAVNIYAQCVTEQVRAAESLRESEELYRTIFENASDEIIYLDVRGRIVDINKRVEDLIGYERAELIGKHFTKLKALKLGNMPKAIAVFADLIKSGSSDVLHEFTLVHKDGHDVIVEVNARTLRKDGRIQGVLAVARDVTEKKQVEETLAKERGERDTILDSIPAMIFFKDKDNRLLQVNKALANAAQLSPADMEGKSLSELYPDLAEDYWDDDKEVMASGKPKRNIIEPLETPDGPRWLRTDKIPHFDENGEVDGVIGCSIDITEQKRLEEELKKSAWEWTKTFDAMADMISVHDRDFNIVSVNKAFADLAGKSAEELIGSKCYVSIHKTGVPHPRCPHVEVMATGKPAMTEVHDPNTGRYLEVSCAPIFEADCQEPTASVHIIKDVTAKKLWEREFAELNTLYRNTIDSAGLGIFVVGLDSKMISVNRGGVEMFGYGDEEMLGESVSMFVPPEDGALVGQVIEAALANGKYEGVVTHVRKDGNTFPSDLTVTPIAGPDGKPTAMVAIVKDLSRLMKIQGDLEKSEAQHRTLVESSTDCICNIDLDGRYLYMSPGGLEGHDLTLEKVVGMHMTELAEPPYHDLLNQTLEEAKKGEAQQFQYESECTDGVRWFESTLTPIKDKSGEVKSFIRISRDITERRVADEAVRKAKEEYRTLVESSTDCICHIDLDGNFLYMSPGGLNSHDLTLEKLEGMHMTELAEPPYHDLLNTTLHEATRGEAQRFQYESECTNGVRWFESTLTPVRDRSGNVRSFIRISRDITEARSSSEKIKETLGKLTETFEETVHSLGSMLEKRDPYTAGHQERVSTVAAAIAEEMGLSEDQVTGIRIGALIHDTGKINIPAEILSKPGRLTDIEFDLIRSHAEIGYQILKDIKFPWPVAQIAHEHHERMDGSGYPRGLSGESIMLEARILAVADVVEAMASHRPYRAAKGIDEALDEIEKNKGHLYDAKVVEACLTLFRTKGLELDAKGSRPEIGLAAKS